MNAYNKIKKSSACKIMSKLTKFPDDVNVIIIEFAAIHIEGLINVWKISSTEFGSGIMIMDKEIHLCDRRGHQIIVLDDEGNFLRRWGNYGSGYGQFEYPIDIIKIKNEIYVVDMGNSRIQIFDEKEIFSRSFTSQRLCGPQQIKEKNNLIYCSDQNHAVYIFDLTGMLIKKIGRYEYGNDNIDFYFPTGITTSTTALYVIDSSHLIRQFDLNGNYIREWYVLLENGVINHTISIAATDEVLYVCDRRGNEIRVYDMNGKFLRIVSEEFMCPNRILVDDNKLYVVDINTIKILGTDILLANPISFKQSKPSCCSII